jgi:hypothetical protein
MIKRTMHYIDQYNDIMSWKLWNKLGQAIKSPQLFSLWTSLLFTITLYLPFLSQNVTKRSFFYYGDVINLWIPQLFNTLGLNSEFAFKGIDFFTHGGASEYFLRPNILTYNPVVLALGWVFDYTHLAGTLHGTLWVYLWLLIIHSFLACYFTQKLCQKYIRLDQYTSLFIGVSFAASFLILNNYTLPPFFLVASLAPACVYALLCCYKKLSLTNALLSSLIMVTIYNSGYLMLSVFTIFISVLFSYFYLWIHKQFTLKNLISILAPALLASLIVLPLYYEILLFNQKASHGLTLFSAAHALGTNPNTLLRLFSTHISYGKGEIEQVVIGLLPMAIILMFIFSIKDGKLRLSPSHRMIAAFSFISFAIILLTCLGVYSPFSYFMYLVPIFGKTHLYGRYLIPLALFISIGVGILLKSLLEERNTKLHKNTF